MNTVGPPLKKIAVFGSSGAIGRALTEQLAAQHTHATVHAFSRALPTLAAPNIRGHAVNYDDEKFLAKAVASAAHDGSFDLVIVAIGILHQDTVTPEKSLRDITAEKCHFLFSINTILPTLIAKHTLPHLARDQRAVFAALSARVGSISDNQLGGWYAYRASKAALNMMIKNAAIETSRRNKHAIIVGLHPGTVDSALSLPFQGNVPQGKLFTPTHAAGCLITVLNRLTPHDSGKCFAWDGQEIAP